MRSKQRNTYDYMTLIKAVRRANITTTMQISKTNRWHMPACDMRQQQICLSVVHDSRLSVTASEVIPAFCVVILMWCAFVSLNMIAFNIRFNEWQECKSKQRTFTLSILIVGIVSKGHRRACGQQWSLQLDVKIVMHAQDIETKCVVIISFIVFHLKAKLGTQMLCHSWFEAFNLFLPTPKKKHTKSH